MSTTPGAAERARFLAALPWCVNGTINERERAWVEGYLQCHPQAAEDLALDRGIVQSLQARVAQLPADVGLESLMRQVHAEQASAQPAQRIAARGRGGPAAWLRAWWSEPGAMRFAGAMAVVAVQAAVIGVLLLDEPAQTVQWRSPAGAPAAALRIAFDARATEQSIREALQAAGVRLAHGPNQLGEYWAVPVRGTLQEALAALERSPVVASALVDHAGIPAGDALGGAR